LKHSKSSSSYLGGLNDSQTQQQQISFLTSINNNNNRNSHQLITESSQLKSPSALLQLFQNSKAVMSSQSIISNNSDDFNSTTNSSSQMKLFNNRKPTTATTTTNPNTVRKTSFLQLKQRSVSSTGHVNNREREILDQADRMTLEQCVDDEDNDLILQQSFAIPPPKFSDKKRPPPVPIQQHLLNYPEPQIQIMIVDSDTIKKHGKHAILSAAAAKVAAQQKQLQLQQQQQQQQLNRQRRSQSQNVMRTGSCKASLPDLTFLKDYQDETTTTTTTTGQHRSRTSTHQQQQTQTANQKLAGGDISEAEANILQTSTALAVTNGNVDLLKRKTLKSIKRYRHNKQSTEPCVLQPLEIVDNHQWYNQSSFSVSTTEESQHKCSNTNKNRPLDIVSKSPSSTTSSSTSTSTGSGQSGHHHFIPLKSCLKRKDETVKTPTTTKIQLKASSNVSVLRRHPQPPPLAPKPIIQKPLPIPLPTVLSASSVIVKSRPLITNKIEKKASKTSTIMFLPFTGHLFSCDIQSETRYTYYNNFTNKRKYKMYKMICNFTNSNDDDDDDDDDNYVDNNIPVKNLSTTKQNINSQSDNDLRRVKKSVSFLNRVIEYKQLRSKISPSSTTTTTTDTSLSKEASPIHLKIKQTKMDEREAPLLQYNSLIALLKSHQTNNNISKKMIVSPQLQKKQLLTKSSSINNKNKQKYGFDNKTGQRSRAMTTGSVLSFNTSSSSSSQSKNIKPTIDADSISLASLSESPPSEFKFTSDDDNNDDDDEDYHSLISPMIKPFNKTTKINPKKEATKTTVVIGQSINNSKPKMDEIKLNTSQQQQQQQQQHQIKMNQIRLKKKNFHAVLLKDQKCKKKF
jgi:hypothetical protein